MKLKHISNNFTQGFQKRQYCYDRIMPLYASSAHAAHVPARLQATWAEFARRGGLSDQKIKKGTFLRIEKLSF